MNLVVVDRSPDGKRVRSVRKRLQFLRPTGQSYMMRIATFCVWLAAGLIGSSSFAIGEPKAGTCSGVLSKFQDDFVLKLGREGICTFSGDDEKKILAVCTEGHRCEAFGLVDDCKDSGECVAISGIASVKDITATQQLSRQKRRR